MARKRGKGAGAVAVRDGVAAVVMLGLAGGGGGGWQVRRRKGLAVEEKLVEHAEKQRTRSRRK